MWCAECNDRSETSIAMLIQPNSTIQHMIPISDQKKDARSGSSWGLMSVPGSYLVGNGLCSNFGKLYFGGKYSDT